jgi:hypothetical protein
MALKSVPQFSLVCIPSCVRLFTASIDIQFTNPITILPTATVTFYLTIPKCLLLYVASIARKETDSLHVTATARKACWATTAGQDAITSRGPLIYIAKETISSNHS